MFNQIGLPGIILIAVVVLILFGRGKISDLMGDVAKGIKSFVIMAFHLGNWSPFKIDLYKFK